ncbi:MAG: caspase family protein [bacterium]
MAKKALLVGINDYKQVNDLNGCVNDVLNMRDILLKYFDFTVSNIRVLTNFRSTKLNILTRLKWLLKDAKKEDILIFHFSGHGTQIRDREGDELKDYLDEAICPYDVNWDGGLILDDDLYNIFQNLAKGVHLEIILDTCNSGTGTRDFIPNKNIKIKFLQPPIDILCRKEENLKVKKIGLKKEQKKLNHILWTACKDNQTSADAFIDNAYNGAFTYYFCKHIRENKGKITREELIKKIRFSLKQNDFSQIPQIEITSLIKKKKFVFQY